MTDDPAPDAAPLSEAAVEAPPTPAPETPPPSEAVPDAAAAAARAQAAELTRIGAQAARLGVAVDVAAAIEAGTEPAALRRRVLDGLAEKAAAGALVNTGPAPVEGESALVALARTRAARAAAPRG